MVCHTLYDLNEIVCHIRNKRNTKEKQFVWGHKNNNTHLKKTAKCKYLNLNINMTFFEEEKSMEKTTQVFLKSLNCIKFIKKKQQKF